MAWYIFALLGAFFDATYQVLTKKFLKKINLYILASGIFLNSFFILFLISLFKGLPKISSDFYVSILSTTIILAFFIIFIFKALKITDLSLAAPMLSFTPIFLIFTSFILLKEIPTLIGIIGIILIVIGSYILNIDNKTTKSLDPIKNIFRNKGIFFMLIAAFLASIGSVFDKRIVLSSDSTFGHSIVYLLTGIIFLIISKFKNVNIKQAYKENFHKFFLTALILILGTITVNIAFKTQITPYVISLKRLSILFTVFYGAFIFKEKNMIIRSLATLVMLTGTVLIIAF